jgi:outer membrane protein TolC
VRRQILPKTQFSSASSRRRLQAFSPDKISSQDGSFENIIPHQMRNGDPDKNPVEPQLVKFYLHLTGGPESTARSVFMYVCPPPDECDETTAKSTPLRHATESASASSFDHAALVLILIWLVIPKAHSASLPDNFPSSPISLADAVNFALVQSPSILRAQKDLQATQGVVIQTRAVALPAVNIGSSYSAAQRTDVDIIEVPGFVLGAAQNWSSQIRVQQSFYEGGRLLSSLRVARLSKEQSLLNYQTAVSDTVLSVQIGYFDVLLNMQQILVQEASVELLTRELADTTRRYDAGTVPRFNVLRAQVELANARPRLITARNNLRVSKNNLANLIGFNVPRESLEDIPLILSSKLDADPFQMDLPHAISLALEKRTELGALEKAQALRREDIVNAKAGFKPILQAYAGYDIHNSILSTDLTDYKNGWIGGAQLTWNIFDGLRTKGKVLEATANYNKAGVELDEATRRITLEVRTAHSNFIEAQEVLESQKQVVEEAEEALRLARARNEAGSGTQLDVLSAQTALTDARSTQVQALHDYDVARSRLQRAVGTTVQ